MKLTFDSPRFDYRNSNSSDIEKVIKQVGHVVLDNVWNKKYVEKLKQWTSERYLNDDKKYQDNLQKTQKSVIDSYLGNHLDFQQLCYQNDGSVKNLEEELIEEFEKTGLPSLFKKMLKGSFMLGISDRVVRRADPKFKIRFTGLHSDGQLRACSREGLNSTDEYTLWTPLVDCVDDLTPRLLMLHKDEKKFNDLFEEEILDKGGGSPHSLVQLRPFQIYDEDNFISKYQAEIFKSFRKIYEHKKCFAPYVPVGSVIIFDCNVIHGTYITEKMNKPRYSLDCRFTGIFKITKNNRMYRGILFQRTKDYPNNLQQKVINNLNKKIIKKILSHGKAFCLHLKSKIK
jgi:hypothetical protein